MEGEGRKKNLYLAGGLFNAAQRLHNVRLKEALEELGYEVILPQERACNFFDSQTKIFDTKKIAEDCRECCKDPGNIFVGNLDGADADSGMAVEFSTAWDVTGRAILYRTDFRTDMERELGVNAMFQCENVEIIYYPCFWANEEGIKIFYRELAKKIAAAILDLDLD